MNWPRIILDGIVMSTVFNAVVLAGFTFWPQEYSVMFSKEIKEAAAPYVNKAEARKMKLFLYGLYFALFFYWAISAHLLGIKGFSIAGCRRRSEIGSKVRSIARRGSERNGF